MQLCGHTAILLNSELSPVLLSTIEREQNATIFSYIFITVT